MLKVLKFGGSSMADAKQFEKVKSIVQADPARRGRAAAPGGWSSFPPQESGFPTTTS